MFLKHAWAPLLAMTMVSAQVYKVVNNCPTTIQFYIGQQSQGDMLTGSSREYSGLGAAAGFFYTSTNGGIVGDGFYAARAGFFFEPKYWYYYIVRDLNANDFNTGISIKPNQTEANGFCGTAICELGNCTTAFTFPPVYHGGPPPDNSPAPSPPNYQCKVDPSQISFEIKFCPSGRFPPEVGSPVYHNFNYKKCMDVRGGVFANGTPVQIYDCNGTPAQRWVLHNYLNGTKVRVANTNYCLDTGANPGDGTAMKIWQCYDNLPAQQWKFNNTNRIFISGSSPSICLDLPNGNEANGNVLQTWTCGDYNNLNQAWSINA